MGATRYRAGHAERILLLAIVNPGDAGSHMRQEAPREEIESMSSLPQNVQSLVDRANAHFQPPENPESESAATEDESAPEGSGNPGERTTDHGDTDTSGQPEQSKSSASEQPGTAETRDARYWEHRFNVLKGKYDSEVPELRRERDELQRQLDEQRNQSGGDSGDQSAAQRLQNAAGELSQEEIDEFGPELVQLVRKLIDQSSGSNNGRDDRVDQIQQRLDREDEERQQHAAARFWTRLEERVPKYREINSDQGFLDWLSGYDRLRGTTRQQLLVEAQQAGDAERVADLFDSYLHESGGTSGAESAERRIPEDQIQPRQSRSTETPQGEVIWTRDEINEFYRKKREGRYSADEAARMEADIFAAQKQGRVR